MKNVQAIAVSSNSQRLPLQKSNFYPLNVHQLACSWQLPKLRHGVKHTTGAVPVALLALSSFVLLAAARFAVTKAPELGVRASIFQTSCPSNINLENGSRLGICKGSSAAFGYVDTPAGTPSLR